MREGRNLINTQIWWISGVSMHAHARMPEICLRNANSRFVRCLKNQSMRIARLQNCLVSPRRTTNQEKQKVIAQMTREVFCTLAVRWLLFQERNEYF
jgi:coproporphyrinogen III oxidase